MKKEEVIEYFGSIKKAAAALDVYPQTIYQWGETVPELMQYKVQVITKGKLKAGKE